MKYLFSTDGSELFVTLDIESGKYAPEILTFNDPNITLENDIIWFYENGRFLRNFSFNHIGTISGVTPTSIQDAFDKISVIAGSISSSSSINTAFTEEPYTETMSVVYNASQPNFDINLTGNLDLIITGTTNKASGMVNLYFSGTEVATLNGFKPLVITGSGEKIPIYFIHDSDGLNWYRDETGGASVDTSLFALQDGTILYHIFPVTNTGTFSNVGNICVGTGTNMNDFWIGSKVIKSNGETAILATVTDSTHFTTAQPFSTDSTDASFEVVSRALKINSDGSIDRFRPNCELYDKMNSNGSGKYNAMTFDSNGNVTFNGFLFGLSNGEVVIKQDGSFKANIPSYVDDAEATSDTNLPSNYFYRVGKEVRIK